MRYDIQHEDLVNLFFKHTHKSSPLATNENGVEAEEADEGDLGLRDSDVAFHHDPN